MKISNLYVVLYTAILILFSANSGNLIAMERSDVQSNDYMTAKNRLLEAFGKFNSYKRDLQDSVATFPRDIAQQYHARCAECCKMLEAAKTCQSSILTFDSQSNPQNSIILRRHYIEFNMMVNYFESAVQKLAEFVQFKKQQDADLALAMKIQAEEIRQQVKQDANMLINNRTTMAVNTALTCHLPSSYCFGQNANEQLLSLSKGCNIKVTECGCFLLPASLQKLPKAKIEYFPSPNENNRAQCTCGSQAIANALGIKQAVQNNCLDASHVYYNAAVDRGLHTYQGTGGHEYIGMAKAFEIKNLHYLICLRSLNNPFVVRCSTEANPLALGMFEKDSVGDTNEFNILEDVAASASNNLFSSLRKDETVTAFFVCSVDFNQANDHAVLIAVVKQKNKIPEIIYMDCNNQRVAEHSTSAAFIRYIYMQLFA